MTEHLMDDPMPVTYHYGAFPPQLDWNALVPHLGPAHSALARYDGLLTAIPNPNVLLAPLTTREAVLSSKIEGTQATLGEIYEFEAAPKNKRMSDDKREDIHEVLNYRKAIHEAESQLKRLPLSTRIIKEVHKTLLTGVRGQNRAPGQTRKIANWIGVPGSKIEDARFVPISPDKLDRALSDWEKYIHQDSVDLLAQLAIIHAEFEALHPFLDGNGRLGRIMIPLFLWQKNLIQAPVFYLSAFLEANREEYYERLLAISRSGAWTEWVAFFLRAITSQSEENQQKATEILALYDRLKIQIVEATHSQYATQALDWIFQQPILHSRDFIRGLDVAPATGRRLLSSLHECEILKEVEAARGNQPAIYSFPELLNIVEGETIF